jgi:hypothetical protein
VIRSVRNVIERDHQATMAARRLPCLAALALGLLVTGATRPALAQQDAEKQVQRMNKRAMADYDALEFELARKTLMDAVALLRQSGIDETPTAAKTYLNLGVVYVAGFKDRNRGLQQFVQALKINPALKLDPAVASPELEEVWSAARKQAGVTGKEPGGKEPGGKEPGGKEPGGKEPGEGDHGKNGEEPKGLIHSPIDEAHPGEPLTVKVQVGSDIGAAKVFLLYRQSGQADYTPLQMKNNGGAEFVAIIPGGDVGDRPLQYYIEARDKKGRPLVGSGSAPNPYIVTLSESAPGARIVRKDETKKPDDPKKFHRLFVFVMPGFGFGYHPGGNTTEVAWQLKSNAQGQVLYQRAAVDSPGGVAIAPFHIGVELGGMVTRALSLSLLGRFEVVTGANAQTVRTETGEPPMGGTTKAGGAVAGFIRARYRFLSGKLHPYVHVDIGGGEIRHALNLAQAQTADKPLVDEATARAYNDDPSATINRQIVCAETANCYDSMRMGLLFIGGGAGLWYDVHKYIGLVLDLNVLGAIGVGNGQSGMNIDVQLGVGAHFL